MLSRMRIIKSLPLIAVLFTCVVILSSAAIFASEESTPSSEVTSWLAPDFDSLQYKQLAEEIYPNLSDATRAVHDVNDIYLLLYDDIRPALMGVSSGGNYSLPRIAFYEREIYNAIFGNASGNNFFDGLHELLTFYAGGQYYSIADLQGMTWARVGDIYSSLNLTNSYLSAISSQLTGYNWITSGAYVGTSRNFDTNYLTVNTSATSFKSAFAFVNHEYPALVRLKLPIYRGAVPNLNTSDYKLNAIKALVGGNFYDIAIPDYFIEFQGNSIYLYLFGFCPNEWTYFFEITTDKAMTFTASASGSSSYIDFNTDDYQQLKQAFYQAKAANAQGSMASDVKRLADYLADPDKIAAEQASQGVIDDTLDGFTGSGSAAAKGSDIGSMKNISGSVQSGLDTGAGVSNATNVFSLNGGFWGWFTQSNSDQINNPYPAPVVNNNRKSSGDDVVDFLSDNQSQVKDLLGESKW